MIKIVQLVKRNKIVHVGFFAKVDGEINTYSACNKRWDTDDKVSTGDRSEVTCKRCQKILNRTDENGYATF